MTKPNVRILALFAFAPLAAALVQIPGTDAHAANDSSGVIQLAQAGSAQNARKAVISGIKSFEAKNYQAAASTLSIALSGQGLTVKDTAKALYYRGRAYRALKKYPQAITDLTSALWLNDGLNEAERKQAEKDRSAAYAGVGVAKPSKVARATTPTAQAATPTPPAAPAATKPDVPVATKTPSTPKPAAAKTAAAKPAPATTAPAGWQTTVGADQPKTAEPAPTSTAQTSNPLAQVGAFFSNMTNAITGGASTATAPAQKSPPNTTASTPPTSAISSWNSEVKVAANTARPTTPARKATPSRPVTTAAPKTAAPKGKYSVQLATVRSRSEAERLAIEVNKRLAPSLGPRKPRIDEAVLGNMGTFYQVKVGPFASKTEPQKLCGQLKTAGLDCLIKTN